MPTSNDPLLVGLDVGTTNIKAVIFDITGQPVAQASVSTPTYYPQPSWAYYKAEELWQCTVAAIRTAVAKIDNPGRIVSVASASMGEAGAPIDAHGQPTYDVIAWFDGRTQPQIEWLDRTLGKDHLFDVTGLSLQPIFGLGKLLWLKENQPDAFARTVRWLNMADYIAYRLCGVPATDYSLASRTMALNLHRLQWADDLLQEVGLPADLFAPACVSGTRLGPVLPEVAAITGLPTTAQVATGGHDHVCGALAVGVIEPGSLLNSMGTAENLFLPLTQPLTDAEMGRQGYTQGVHVVPGQYYVFGASYTSGACVDWLRQIFGGGDYAALIAAAGQVPPGSLGVCFLPHLRLANAPFDDPKGRGAFIGLSTDVKPETLFRAVLEGLAYEAHYVVDSLLKFMDTSTLHRIHAIGGSTRNRLLMQLKATVFNQPVIVTTMTEATSLGAALLGGLGAGVYADVPAALGQLKRDEVVVEPLAEQVALYETYFRQVYQQLYLALRPLHHTIYQLQN